MNKYQVEKLNELNQNQDLIRSLFFSATFKRDKFKSLNREV